VCLNLSLSVERHEREGQPLKRLLRILTPTEGGLSHARRGRGSAARRRRGTAVAPAAAPPTGTATAARLDQATPRAAAEGGPGGMLAQHGPM